MNNIDNSTLTVAAASIGLSSASPTVATALTAGAQGAIIYVQTAPVYYREDGDAATSADPILNPGDALQIMGGHNRQILNNLRFLRKGDTSAELKIVWYDSEAAYGPRLIRGSALLVAGSDTIGKVGIDQTTLGTTNGVVRVKGGLLSSGVKSADDTIKNAAGAVYWLTVSDTAALAIELSDNAVDQWALALPAGGYAHFIFDPPLEFATGIVLDVSTATCKVTIGYI